MILLFFGRFWSLKSIKNRLLLKDFNLQILRIEVIVPSQLVMACVGKELILWGCQCGTVETLAVFKSAPTALLADVSSQRVLVGCHNGHLELLKINQKWSLDFEHDPGRGWVTAIQAFWKDDLAVVAFHNYDSELVIYDLTKGDCLRRLPQPEEVMPNQMAVGISGVLSMLSMLQLQASRHVRSISILCLEMC